MAVLSRLRLFLVGLLLLVVAPQISHAAPSLQTAKDTVGSQAFRLQTAQLYYQKLLGRAATATEATDFATQWNTADDGWKQAIITLAGSSAYFENAGGTNQSFVTHLFQDLAGRAPDETEELPAALDFLKTGERSALADVVAGSDAFKAVTVKDWYQRLLGRAPTTSEAEAGSTKLDASGANGLIIDLVTTTEYFEASGNTDAAWKSELQQDLLNSSGETPGSEPATVPDSTPAPMGVEENDRAPLVRALLASAEYRTSQINEWYQKFLKRKATPQEVTKWSTVLKNNSADTVIVGILTTDEYFNRSGGTTDAFLKRVSQDLMGKSTGGKAGIPTNKSDLLDLILPRLQK